MKRWLNRTRTFDGGSSGGGKGEHTQIEFPKGVKESKTNLLVQLNEKLEINNKQRRGKKKSIKKKKKP